MAKVPVRVSIEPDAAESAARFVRDRLNSYNVTATGHAEYFPVSIFLRGPDAEVLGGLLGGTWGGWLHVSNLWVADAVRGSGHGSALLAAAEQMAVERGCDRAYLESFSFQAPDFYRHRGYEVFATLEGFPAGHRQYYLKKSLPRPRQ
jgi:GNAT superfamily N-acetyltransferase